MAVCPFSVWVVTFSCGVDCSLPLACALARSCCTAFMTSGCCARNALPRSVVQRMS